MCFECRDTWCDDSLRLSDVASYVDGLGAKKTLLYIYRFHEEDMSSSYIDDII